MAKGSKAQKPSSARSGASSAEDVATQLAKLKNDATQLFLKKEYSKAADAYDQAIKLVSGTDPEKADLLQKKAGCLMTLQRYKDAIRECSVLLELQPNLPAALKTRAKAYEQQQLYKNALSDLIAVNKTAATDETREAEKRIRGLMAGKEKPSGLGSGGLQQRGPTRATANNHSPYMVNVKCTLGSETRQFSAGFTLTYPELLEVVREKFPAAGPVLLKYTDKDGDEVTVTSTTDVQAHLMEVMVQHRHAQATGAAKALGLAAIPALRFRLVQVASEAEVPSAAADEVAQAKARQAALAEQQRQQQQQAEGAAPGPYDVMDEWVVDFARSFIDLTGIDLNAFYESHQNASEKLTRAVDVALSTEEALPLFDKAMDHYCDAIVTSLVNWCSTHTMRMERKVQAELKKRNMLVGPLPAELLAEVLTEYAKGEEKLNQALSFKPDAHEPLSTLAQLEMERAKAKAGLAIAMPHVADEGRPVEEVAKEQQEALLVRSKEAYSKVKADTLKTVVSHIERSESLLAQALGLAKAADERRKQAQAAAGAKEESLTPEQQAAMKLQSATGGVLVMHGNILFELSQMQAGAGLPEWKATLDKAVEKFKEAGAQEADIRVALKTHFKKDELDLGPDPEPATPAVAAPAAAPAEAKPAAAAAAPPAAKPEAKGLPSLSVKGKKKEKAAEAGKA